MIFASDLDRTLIYSSKFTDVEVDLIVVEHKNGKPVTFMSEKAKEMLTKLRKQVKFVPVTTRTVEEYKRINLFHGKNQPEYAITSNGGNILKNGVIDLEWQKRIRKNMKTDGFDLPFVYNYVKPLLTQSWVEYSKIADDMFFCLYVNKNKVDTPLLEEWKLKLKEMNWKLIPHGRKIYCIPMCVNKRDAVKYIASKMKIKHIVSSGDSRMDLTMESISNTFIVPRHGELVLHDFIEEGDDVRFTKKTGIRAAESVLSLASDEIIA